MNALMSIAVTGAMLIGHWPEAAMVMVLFALAEVIEAKSLDRARNAIRGLLDLTPEQATVQQADGTWREVGAKQITIGARVRVKPVSASPLMVRCWKAALPSTKPRSRVKASRSKNPR